MDRTDPDFTVSASIAPNILDTVYPLSLLMNSHNWKFTGGVMEKLTVDSKMLRKLLALYFAPRSIDESELKNLIEDLIPIRGHLCDLISRHVAVYVMPSSFGR